MIRISLAYVFVLGETFERINRLTAGVKYGDVFIDLWNAQAQLEGLYSNSVFSASLRSSYQTGQSLLSAIKAQTDKTDFERNLGPTDIIKISSAWTQFRTALLAELNTLPAYFVSQKGGFDTLTLLEQSWRLFPSDLVSKVPEAMFDVAEAGKALCYELPTSCGFHVFRATETVLRRYYSLATGGQPQPKIRNIAVYINAMRQRKCGDEKILSVLDQMSKLHRNPLIHPDVVLRTDEAISIVGMAHSAITAMLSALPVLPPTTATPVLDFSSFVDTVSAAGPSALPKS